MFSIQTILNVTDRISMLDLPRLISQTMDKLPIHQASKTQYRYFAVYSFGGLINHIEPYGNFQVAKNSMINFLTKHGFDYTEDDARIFDIQGMEVYSFEHEKYM